MKHTLKKSLNRIWKDAVYTVSGVDFKYLYYKIYRISCSDVDLDPDPFGSWYNQSGSKSLITCNTIYVESCKLLSSSNEVSGSAKFHIKELSAVRRTNPIRYQKGQTHVHSYNGYMVNNNNNYKSSITRFNHCTGTGRMYSDL